MDTVALCNDALGRVAERAIMSLDDATNEARLCKRHFSTTAREVLRDGTWRCARKRVALSPLAEPPAWGWARQFQLPSDFIRTISLNGGQCGAEHCPLFEIEGRVLLTNEATARIVYVRDITMEGAPGVGDADPLLTRAMSLALAAKMAWQFQQSRALRESLLAEYEDVLRSARTVNARDAFENTVAAANADWCDFYTGRV